MGNVNKYWIIMESLHFPMVGAPTDSSLSEEERVKTNLKLLRDCIKHTPEDIIKQIIKDKTMPQMEYKLQKIVDKADEYFLYCLYSLEVLLKIHKNVNFSSNAREDLVSERHKSLLISSIIDVASIELQGNLNPSFYKDKGAIFKQKHGGQTNLYRLEFMVEIFSPLMHIKALHVGKSLDDVQLWYMASIFSLLIAFDSKDYHLEQDEIGNLQTKLQKLWLELSKKVYYRSLMLLYSTLANTRKERIHREMLLRLWSPGGFIALLFAMTEAKRSEEQSLDENVANLVAQPSFSIKAQHSLIKQVLQFLKASLKNEDFAELISPAMLSLKKLCDNKKENKEFIRRWVEDQTKTLIEVEMTNLIAMEWLNFVELISLLFHIFCTSSIATLHTDILLPYLSVFLELYSQLECHIDHTALKNHLHSLVLNILNNLSKGELKQVIKCVALKSYPKEWFQLSPNIQIKANALNMQELKLSIVPLKMDHNYHLPTSVSILKSSSFNLLVYQLFLTLLQMLPSLIMDKNISSTSNTNIDLLTNDEDIYNKMLLDYTEMYQSKLQVVKALESLVQHQPLKALINDNCKELLKVLQDILVAYTTTHSKDTTQKEINSTVLVILLILIIEIIENCSLNAEDMQKNLFKPLKELQSQTENEHLKFQINSLLENITKGHNLCNSHPDYLLCGSSKNQFEEARILIESNKSYLQVEGIEKMIKLLNKRDTLTIANSHMLTALALNTLKSPESYTFLNCVRMFVALVNVNETEVLDILSDEYLNEEAVMDYRLVVGEAILRTSRELGPLCYKYKDILLNAYMTGCRSPLNEFRFSAFSNLSQMCRQLTYQVHNYFHELLSLLECELTNGKYLPAKRAAAMVLSDLLAGMDNLFDYEEMLLPIYRLLKQLLLDKNDLKIVVHASNGLKTIDEKCKELFKKSLEQNYQGKQLEKETKIMGIHDRPKKSLKSHILEIN